MLNETVLACKEVEYTGRLALAFHLGDFEKARKLALTVLVLYRLQSRTVHARAVAKMDEVRALKRSTEKAKAEGVTVPLAELRVKKLEGERDAAEKALACVGEEMCSMLDLWQSVGATLEDLCNLCNRDPAQVKKKLGDERLEESFSELAMVYNLDYKNPRDTGWLEDSVDAPLTHALKAYLLDTMLHTEAGRKASHEAMAAVFPEIMENALTEYTDADGVRHLIDKDRVEVGTLDSEE